MSYDFNLIAAISGIIVSIILTILITRYQVKKNIELAERTAALDKPNIQLGFCNYVMRNEIQCAIVFGVPKDNITSTLIVEFEISNKGAVTAEDITVLITLNKKFGFSNDKHKEQVNYRIQTADRKHSLKEEETEIIYHFKSIHPAMRMVIPEFLTFKLNTVDELLKTNYININNPMIFINEFEKMDGDLQITLYGKNQRTRTYHFKLFTVQTETIEELKEKLNGQSIIKMAYFPRYKFFIQTNVKITRVHDKKINENIRSFVDRYEFGISDVFFTD